MSSKLYNFYITFHFLTTLLLFHASILIITATTISTSASAATTRTRGGNETDSLALLAFKSNIIQDPLGALTSWNNNNTSLHFCEWQGVTCSRRHQRVTILDLRSMNLVGSLSPYIGNMSFLREITLFNNTLQGEIPRELGHLFRLRVLSLDRNSLSGEIPRELSRLSRLRVLRIYKNFLSGEIPPELSNCSDLIFLRVDFNKLVGKIPTELASLSKLESFAVDRNFLGGVIPSFLGNFTSLGAISASNNDFEGNIPSSLGKLQSLKFLALGVNRLSGTIPQSIYNLSSISVFALAGNELFGGLPPNLFLTFPRLSLFQIYSNRFSGPIPISLSNASELVYIDMSENNFSGKVSIYSGGLQRLQQLILWRNNLGLGGADEMNFLGSLTNCSNLEAVGLQINQFRGTLPNFVANLSTRLEYLALESNQIYGVIPSGIGYLVNLTHLDLGFNMLTGEIPSTISNLKQLQRLRLHVNKLSGGIPFSLGNLSSLALLYLPVNKLQGAIPPSLGDLQRLLTLDLSRNNLNGTIPKQIFAISTLSISLNLAGNRLMGPIPPYIRNLTRLVELNFSENELSGEIPSDLGQCLGLENLFMGRNLFRGIIPPSLSSLRGLKYLDLSRNNLSGQIPKYLETFPLAMVDLSFNDFEGEVPTKGVFTNASAFSVTGNQKLCGGIDDLKFPKCKVNKDKMSRGLLVTIPIVSTVVGTFVVVSLVCFWFKKGRKRKSQGSLEKELIMKVSYQDLLKATDGFSSSNLIGVGGFGSVYKGGLDKTTVAIKVLDLQRRGALKSFTSECEALRNIRHRNLVKVLTCCSGVDFQGNEFKAIVYELMQNGSLDRWLHQTSEKENGQHETLSLDLLQRINIAIDVACALDYIHHHCHEPIVHCDLKPSNVLLDHEMTAHVGDFGLSKFLPELTSANQTSSLGIRGTIGYAAPEYGMGNEPSTFGDVYSYGVLLLEIVTGKRPTDNLFSEGHNLHKFVETALPDRVMEIVDPTLTCSINLGYEKSEECLRSLAKIGVACSMEAPHDRADICSVVNELCTLKAVVLKWGSQANNTEFQVHGV